MATFPDYELITKGGISLGTNFELLSNKPLDSRLVVPSLEALQHYIDNAAAYEGMIAYVTSENKHYEVKTIDGVLSYKQFGLTTEELNEIITDATTAAMEFKGATNKLPENPSKGDMWKVTAEFAVGEETAKVGDSIVYNGEQWFLIPSGDDIEDTWRPVTNVDNDAALTFVEGDILDVVVTNDGTITYKHEKIAAPELLAANEPTRTYITEVETDGYGHITGYKTATENVEDINTEYTFESQVESSSVYFNVTPDTEDATKQTVYVDAYSTNEIDAKVKALNLEIYGNEAVQETSRIDTAVADAAEAKSTAHIAAGDAAQAKTDAAEALRIAGEANSAASDAKNGAAASAAAAAASAGEAAASATTATQKASAASQSADAAEAARASASGFAEDAGRSESNASASADAAATSETNAGKSATAADASAKAAATSESNAGQSASAAATSEANADASAKAADASAKAAAASESNAAASEENASKSAEAAAESAHTAEDYALQANTSFVTAEAAQRAAEIAQVKAEEARAAAEASNTSATAIANEAKETANAAKETANSAKTASKTATTNVTNLTNTINGYGDIVTHNVAEFATKAQGEKADSAVQSIATGTTNGTIAVDGTDVAVAGLGSAAYEEASAFDAAGAAAAVLGTSDDIYYPPNGSEPEYPSAYTVHSAINLAQTKISDIYGSETINVEDISLPFPGSSIDKSLHVNISTKGDNALKVIPMHDDEEAGEQWTGGLYVKIPEAPKYSIAKDANSGNFAAVYHLTENGKNIGAAINIPKDMVVESGEVVTYAVETDGQAAGTYIKLKLQNVDDALYINVGDLIEYVTGDTAKDGMITITVDENYVATAVINNGTITKAKLEASVQTSLDKADTALQAADIGTMAKEAAADYVKKSDATGYNDILTKTAAEDLYQAKGEYATAAQGKKADSALQKVDLVASGEGSNGSVDIVIENSAGEDATIQFHVSNTIEHSYIEMGGVHSSVKIAANEGLDANDDGLIVADKGITTAKIADAAVGAAQTKAFQTKTPTKDDQGSEEVWVFYCGTSEILV